MQNIPRDETAGLIKKMFIPKRDGWLLIQMDLSQAELRGLGTLAADPTFKHAYENDLDIHTFTASQMWNIPMEEVTKPQRSNSKRINFGIAYGASARRLSAEAKIPLAEAQALLDSWYATYAGVKVWQEEIFRQVDEDQCVYGVWGLKRRLPSSMSREDNNADLKRVAGNFPIQGFASEFNLFLLIWIADEMKTRGIDWGVKLVNTVHDSIIYEVHPDCIMELIGIYQWAIGAANDMCREMFGEAYIEMEGDIELGGVWSDLKGVHVDETGQLVYAED